MIFANFSNFFIWYLSHTVLGVHNYVHKFGTNCVQDVVPCNKKTQNLPRSGREVACKILLKNSQILTEKFSGKKRSKIFNTNSQDKNALKSLSKNLIQKKIWGRQDSKITITVDLKKHVIRQTRWNVRG